MTKNIPTLDLYTTQDITEVRNLLIKEQRNQSAMTGLPLDSPVTDHIHDNEQLVRAVINSKENVALGRIEGLYARYVGYWYKGTYPEFLRLVADYIERGSDGRYRHNMWRAKVLTFFNRLNAKQQDKVLETLGYPKGKNPSERKDYFKKITMNRAFGYDTIKDVIKEVQK
jgi:hypothetical protein